MNKVTSLFLEEKYSKPLLSFALDNYLSDQYFIKNPMSSNRYYCKLDQTKTPVSNLAVNIICNVYGKLGITESEFFLEPYYGIILGIQTQTASVHMHTDPAPEGYIAVRINCLLSKPDQGGVPIVNGEYLQVDRNQFWVNLSNLWHHGCTEVLGSTPRVLLSLGALVSKHNSILKNYLEPMHGKAKN